MENYGEIYNRSYRKLQLTIFYYSTFCHESYGLISFLTSVDSAIIQ